MLRKQQDVRRVFITGAAGFLGFRVMAALLQAGLEITALTRPEQDEKLASLAQRVRIVHGDIWNRGSLKGLARGQDVLVHLVGSVHADPKRGLTHQQINLVSARNAVGMGITDGVPHFVLLSVAALPGMLPGEYVRSKRDAEEYLRNSGLQWVIVRAPLMYVPGVKTPLLRGMGLVGFLPPFRWIMGRYMPFSVETAAGGIAAAVQDIHAHEGRILYVGDLRRLARRNAPSSTLPIRPAIVRQDALSDEAPFGWLPPPAPRRRRDE